MPKQISYETVLQIIERGLNELGESPKQAIWFCLEEKFGFNRKEVPRNIETFEEALQKLFGLGYNFLDALFRQYLHEATGEKFQNCASFAQCVILLQTGVATEVLVKTET